jgi:hypothetical protein
VRQDQTIDRNAAYTDPKHHPIQRTTIMTTTWKTQLTDSLDQAKTVGGSRLTTIRAILQATLPQIWVEITAGAKEIGQISTTVASTTTTTLRAAGKVKTATFRQLIAVQVQKFAEQFKAKATVQMQDLKTQAVDWDVKLEARYGHTYKVARQTIDKIVERYKASQSSYQTTPESATSSPIEVPFQVVEDQAKP